MLSTIIGFTLSFSPIAMDPPEGNISQEVNQSVERIVDRGLGVRIVDRGLGVRIDAKKATMLIIGNREKLEDNH